MHGYSHGSVAIRKESKASSTTSSPDSKLGVTHISNTMQTTHCLIDANVTLSADTIVTKLSIVPFTFLIPYVC
jgi:hypothetical protein